MRTSPDSRLAGESSRLSTSPGAATPTSAELLSFMHNISNMLREQQTTSSLLLQRVVDIESANAERRNKAESNKHTPSRVAISTTSEAEASDTVTDVPVKTERVQREGPDARRDIDDGADTEEEKYETEDIPLTKAEKKTIQLEQQQPEAEIMMPVDEDDALDDYVAWLLRRQKLYPFEDKHCQRLYIPRHTLLSPNGRLREYSRFGFVTNWDVRLFGDLANRWFRRLLHDHGVAPESDKKPRSVSIHLVRVPLMSYDSRDRLSTVRTGEENELPFNSYTLSGLPQLLRGDPGLALARAHSLSLQEEADIYVNQRKRSMIAKGLIDGDSDSDDDDSSTTSSVSSHDTRTCTHCDRPVYGLVKQCSLHAPKA